MKRETRIRAIERLVAKQDAEVAVADAAEAAAAACRGRVEQEAATAAVAAWQANQRAEAAAAAVKSQSKAQRDYAAAAVSAAVGLAKEATWLGGVYSGTTRRCAAWGEATTARTVTSGGEQYSRRCTYRRNDARHEVTITPEGMVDLLAAPEIVAASRDEGLPLLSYLAATGEAAWAVCRNKRLGVERGWIAAEGGMIYHSTESLEHAKRGVARKVAAAAREAGRLTRDRRADRRAALVIRLCRGATATVADAIEAGYCPAGILAWQERHGIGDSAPLADLVRTGDPLATKLAFALARKVRRDTVGVVGAGVTA